MEIAEAKKKKKNKERKKRRRKIEENTYRESVTFTHEEIVKNVL